MLKEYFKSFNIFSESEINEIENIAKFKSLHKNEYLIKENEVCKNVAFIVSGTLRSFYIANNGDEMTYCITFPNQFITAYSSFITGAVSKENIQAITPVEMYLISKEDIESISANNLNWIKFQKIMAEYQYLELENRIFQLQRDSATERYLNLKTSHPEYFSKIPLQYIASYLGITQRHLSRIRKEFN